MVDSEQNRKRSSYFKTAEDYLSQSVFPPKTPRSHEELISILKERGLAFDDISKERAVALLRECHYYRLTAYRFPFVEQDDHDRFLSGAQFSDIWRLYVFDRRLRLMVLDAIERFETSLRARWAHVLAVKHGALAYEDPDLHVEGERYINHLRGIYDVIIQSKEPCITHFLSKRERIPIWSLCEILTQGQLFSAINYLNDASTKNQIFEGLGVDFKRMISFLNVIRNVRNICAHHGRLWNKRLFFEMKFPKNPQCLNTSLIAGEKSVYNVLTILAFLMRRIAPQSKWGNRVYELVDNAEIFIQKGMGFPDDWKKRSIWVEIRELAS